MVKKENNMKEKFSRIPESLFRDDRFTPQEKIIVGFRLGMTDTGYWTYKANTVAELFGVHRTTVMNTYRKMKQYGFLEETEDKQTVMKSIMAESGSLSRCSEMTTPTVVAALQGCSEMTTPTVVAALQGCSEMTTPTPPVFIGKTENVKNIKEDIKNIKEDIKNTKEQLTEQLKQTVIQFAIIKLNMKAISVYNKKSMNPEFVYYKSKGSNDWVGLSKSDFMIAHKQNKVII